MHKSTRLSSGNISDFTPIGQDGQPIYQNADAFRAALAINPSIGEERVRHLAIPKVSADGTSIEWYAPFPPKNADGQYRIVHWASATAEERKDALAQLRDLEIKLQKLGKELSRRTSDTQSRLFAAYLNGDGSVSKLPAIHFPSQDNVYIVDGIPVITFWGFSDRAGNFDGSPWDKLKTVAPAAEVAGAAPAADAAFDNRPVADQKLPETPPNAPDNNQGHKCAIFGPGGMCAGHTCGLPAWLLWLLLALLLLPLLLWLLWKLLGLLGFGLPGFGLPSSPSMPADPPAAVAPADPAKDKPAEPAPEKPAEPAAEPAPEKPVEPAADKAAAQEVAAGSSTVAQETAPSSTQEPQSELTKVPPEEVVPAENTAVQEVVNNEAVPSQANQVVEENATKVATEVTPVAPVDPKMPVDESLANLPPEVQTAIKEARAAEMAATNQVAPPDPAMPKQQAAVTPLPPVDIQFSPQDLATKGTAVVNGNWGTRMALMDESNGKPLQMQYQLNDGKGTVTITRADGTKCTAQVGAASADGNIQISSDGKAVCPDNKTYRIPNVKCAPSKDGKVDCVGTIGNQKFPIELYGGTK